MKRSIVLSKYRNIGLDSPQEFIINNSLEKGKIGNLIILIGANNSGKSNVLDALFSLNDNVNILDRDKTTLSFKPEDLNPTVTLEMKEKGVYLSYEKSLKSSSFVYNNKNEDIITYSLEELIEELNQISNIAIKYNLPTLVNGIKDLISRKDTITSEILIVDFSNLLSNANIGYYRASGVFYKFISELKIKNYKIINEYYSRNSNKEKSNAEKFMSSKFGLPLLPKIIKYNATPVTKQNLSIEVSQLKNSLFFSSIFRVIGIEPDEILNAYEQYRKFNNIATLNKIKNNINKKLVNINKEFNKLYFADNDKYKFGIELTATNLAFSMARGDDEEPIMIEYQSTGFKWFFDFYFNFIASDSLHTGDIIVMDEPATHLHPEGQKELRRFIKEFAIKNDLTFVIATHSPFLIDPDNYDELRIVSMNNNKAKIDNSFTAVNVDDPDSLLPIKEALTIKQNVLYDLDTEVIWVEGITDYNYLTLFKKILDYKNISFLPFQGVGIDDKMQNSIIDKLNKIKFYKRNILVDGDKAGLAMKKNCVNTAFDKIKLISDIQSSSGRKIVEIEDLFSDEDRKKYPVLDKNNEETYKKSYLSSLMKDHCKKEDFSQETLDNFKKLFELLKD